jgi:hypothetical protein
MGPILLSITGVPSTGRFSDQGVAFSKTMTAAVRRENNHLAHWLELDRTLPA